MKKNKKDEELKAAIIIIVLCCTIILTALFGLKRIELKHFEKKDMNIVKKVELASMALNQSSEESFVLGTGTRNGSLYYIAYEVNEDHSKSIYEMESNITKIYDVLDKGEVPFAEEIKDGYGYLKEVKLYIPKNIIQQEYDFSLSQA